MNKKILILVSYIIIFINSNLLSNEDKILKVGLLAPLSGKYAELGNSLLYSLQLALEEIDDKNLSIIPRDAGFDNEEKLKNAIEDIKAQGVKVVIGPISENGFYHLFLHLRQ